MPRKKGVVVKVKENKTEWTAIGLVQRAGTHALGVQLTDILLYTAGQDDEDKCDKVPPSGR